MRHRNLRQGAAPLIQSGPPIKFESVIPNPKLKLLDQIREVMRLKHYSIRTERTYCDWIRRYIQFHKMQNREELQEGEAIKGSPIHARDGLEAWTNLFPYRIEPCRRKR